MASQTPNNVAVDRLSLLPDELLHRILSFIPDTEEKARTSALSHRFRHLWTNHPAVRLGSKHRYRSRQSVINKYLLSVDRCFTSFNSPTLHSLDFHLHASDSSANSNARWIRFAADRSVRELYLHRIPWKREEAAIPEPIFSCKNLTRLEVDSCIFTKIPSDFDGFRRLTTLRFNFCHVSSDILGSLLPKCPLVETLSIDTCPLLTRIEAASARLKHLSVRCCLSLKEARFDAPNLESVVFYGNLKLLFLKGAESLRNASIRHFYWQNYGHPDPMTSLDDWERCLLEVSHTAEALEVSPWLFKFVLPKSREPIFKNLKELICDIPWVTAPILRSLVSVLEHCPNLEKLEINLSNGSRRSMFHKKLNNMQTEEGGSLPPPEPEEEESDTSNEELGGPLPQSDEEHFEKEHKIDQEQEIWDLSELVSNGGDSTLRLKTVVMTAFLGTANEMKLLEYLLSRANALETLTIADCRMDDTEDILQLLAFIRRASPIVQIHEMNNRNSTYWALRLVGLQFQLRFLGRY